MRYLKTFAWFGFLSEIISETLQTPIKTFLQHFEQKNIIFSDISLPKLDRIWV